ncbi:MAG: D-2-hydroxyacid dehydrogenase [Chloroflexia bacterium]|nr:D-2-hydroxyacid dehydrogenase [Chloroflexia bacterium]
MPNRQPLQRVLVAIGSQPVDTSGLTARFPEIEFDGVGPDAVNDHIAEADAALIGWVSPSETLDKAPRLKWIQTAGAGVERVVGDGFADRGILLTNGSGVMAPNMAEHVIGLMLAFARGLPALMQGQQRQSWKNGVGMDTVFELGGQTVLLVGLGDIALATAERLQAFGMTVIGVRRSDASGNPPAHVDRVVSIADLDAVLGEADHVISSLPHTSETQGVFDRDRFARFKDRAYFYNLGRGTSVVQADLIGALESGKLGGAGLDVTDPEPLPEGDPLWDAPNVIITAHTAGATPHFQERVLALFVENIARYQSGEDLVNVVDIERGY